MKKLLFIFNFPIFWWYFLISAIIILVIQLFFNGLFTIPVVNYTVSFMGERLPYDLIYMIFLSILFGIFVGLYSTIKKHNIGVCIFTGAAGFGSLFTLLCPICPVFFLSYFGIFIGVGVFAQYFLAIRIIGIIIILIGIFILYRSVAVPDNFKNKLTPLGLLNNFLALLIIGLLSSNQLMAAKLINDIVYNSQSINISGNINADISNIIAFKTPFYAAELGLDFSNLKEINRSINAMAIMAPNQGSKALQLTKEQMARYIAIGTQPTITCEFCCGVKTLVTNKGMPTCGCAHSKAMRGTAAYLLQNYPDMTNEEISVELAKQKTLYFPKQMAKRLGEQLVSGNYSYDIEYLISQFTEEQIAKLKASAERGGIRPNTESPNMVGGC